MMCPVCLSTTALFITGATSGGGLVALLLRKLLRTIPAKAAVAAIAAESAGAGSA